jgi:hypothetical protein
VIRRRTRYLSLLGVTVVATLVWPGPASADTSLGGYSGFAQAEPVQIQVYEPVIPIPTTPQIDAGIGYTRSTTDTGPVSRGTASYLWPGDTLGDGFGQLTGKPAQQYPVQVNSRYPATTDAPAENTAQLTDGNGMTTSSSDSATTATVTGLGIVGPDTNPLGGLGTGLSNLPGLGGAKSTKPLPSLPIPVSATLAKLVTFENVKSESDVVVGKDSITSTARSYVSEVRLLGGLITIDGMNITSSTVSDGTKATTTGHATVGAIKLAGTDLGLDEDGLNLNGTGVKLPVVPAAITDLLEGFGISIKYLQTARTVSGATGSFATSGLAITVDTAPLKNALSVITGPLGDLISKIPKLGSQLGPVLGLGPKIVLTFGVAQTSATAAPAYVPGSTPPTTSTGGGSGGAGAGTGNSTTGTGSGSIGTGAGLGTGAGNGNPGVTPDPGNADTGAGDVPLASQPAALHLPPLATVPRLLILGALALATVIGWLLRNAAATLFGAGANCDFGLATGVPDLRKG